MATKSIKVEVTIPAKAVAAIAAQLIDYCLDFEDDILKEAGIARKKLLSQLVQDPEFLYVIERGFKEMSLEYIEDLHDYVYRADIALLYDVHKKCEAVMQHRDNEDQQRAAELRFDSDIKDSIAFLKKNGYTVTKKKED